MNAETAGIIYGIRTLDPYTLASIELGYVGKTRRHLRTRETAHRDEQPWADIIVGSAYVIDQGTWSDDDLAGVEQAAIRFLKPRYNVENNVGNGDRISLSLAVQQRQARDRTRGVPVWHPQVPLAPALEPRIIVRPLASRRLPSAGTDGLHEGHRAVLAHLRAGLTKTGRIALAMNYSERQVYNLLTELVRSHGLVERVRQGHYQLVRSDP